MTLDAPETSLREVGAVTRPLPFEPLPREFGGYRVVRVLDHSIDVTTAIVRAADETQVARVYSSRCASATIDRDIAVYDAIARASAELREHVAALYDLVTLSDGRLAIVVELASGPRLSDVLRARHGRLSLGEAVTIMAPLADALDAAHAVGLTGLPMSASTVRFTAAGAPMVVRVTDAVPGPVLPDRLRALEPDYAADAAMFQRLGAAVTAAVVESDRLALAAAVAAPRSGRTHSAALFDLAHPVPVLLHEGLAEGSGPTAPVAPTDRAATTTATTLPGYPTVAANPGATFPTPARPAVTSATSALPSWAIAGLDAMEALGVPRSLVEKARAVATKASESATQLFAHGAPTTTRLATVRRPVLVAGAAGAVALLAALVLMVGGAADDRADAPTPSTSTETSSPAAGAETAATTEVDVEAEADAEAPSVADTPDTIRDPSPDDWPLISTALVERWLTCHLEVMQPRATSECAVSVVHAGSAAERLIAVDDERHERLSTWLDEGGDSVVVERMGGAALIDLVVDGASEAAAPTTAASLLVVRSEAGWRVRDVLDGIPSD